MKFLKPAIAGTLESSDVQVTIQSNDNGIEIRLKSDVIQQYGRQIKNTVMETLKRLDLDNVSVTLVDKGALDCTLRARLECAVFRACGISQTYPWGGTIQ